MLHLNLCPELIRLLCRFLWGEARPETLNPKFVWGEWTAAMCLGLVNHYSPHPIPERAVIQRM
jgi:hypothetical protein